MYSDVCGDPGQVPNAVRSSLTSLDVGGIVRFTCKPGFVMRGQGTLTCQENGHWTPTPVCLLAGKNLSQHNIDLVQKIDQRQDCSRSMPF